MAKFTSKRENTAFPRTANGASIEVNISIAIKERAPLFGCLYLATPLKENVQENVRGHKIIEDAMAQ